MSSKGQVIIPASVRESQHWAVGTELRVEVTPEGVLLKELSTFPPTRIEEVVDVLNYRGPRKSLAQMNQAIARGARALHGRR